MTVPMELHASPGPTSGHIDADKSSTNLTVEEEVQNAANSPRVLDVSPDPFHNEKERTDPVPGHVDGLDSKDLMSDLSPDIGNGIMHQIKVEPCVLPSDTSAGTETTGSVISHISEIDYHIDISPLKNIHTDSSLLKHTELGQSHVSNMDNHKVNSELKHTGEMDMGEGVIGHIKIEPRTPSPSVELDVKYVKSEYHFDRTTAHSVTMEPSGESVESTTDSPSHLNTCRKNLKDLLSGLSSRKCDVFKCALCGFTLGKTPVSLHTVCDTIHVNQVLTF